MDKRNSKKTFGRREILSEKQKDLISKVFKKWSNQVRVIDLLNKQNHVYPSINKASEALCNQFHVTKDVKSALGSITNRLLGKTMSPYKERFMFYYATDEEVEKYLEDKKVSQL